MRARYSGISRGTESLIFRGLVPPSQYLQMRAPHQEGRFPAPVKYGYSSVGEVLEDGRSASVSLVGRTVFCLYPHQDLYHVRASDVMPLPDGVPAGRAVLAANMETAVNALWDGCPSAGDRIVVIGAGVVGLLISWLCRQIPGAELLTVDTRSSRAAPAAALGLPFSVSPPTDARADVVFHASGSPAGLRSALESVGIDGVIVEASWFGDESVSLPLGEAFHSRRITIRGSQVGHVPPRRSSRWTRARRLELALRLLRDSTLDVLITGESDFEDLPSVLARLSADPGDELCHRIRYPSA